MKNLQFSIATLAVLVLTTCAIPSVVFDPEDLVIEQGSTETFTVSLRTEDSDNSTDVWIQFGEENPSNIIKWSPPAVHLRNVGNQSSYTIKVYGDSPGHSVIQGSKVNPLSLNSSDPKNKNRTIKIISLAGTRNNLTDEQFNLEKSFVRINVYRFSWLEIFNQVIGWIFAVSSALSFYPQLWVNWRRKSVVGLQFDFAALNVHGFICLSVFNIAMYWAPEIIEEYHLRHPHGINPVQLSDVIFAAHAALTTILVIVQIFLFERGGQSLSKTGIILLVLIYLFLGITLILSFCSVIQWLDYMYYFSYVKLVITFVKYIPQVYFNYRRKSTAGYSLGNVFLDFFAGAIYLMQMLLIAYNYDDWGSIYGNLAKLGIGLFSVWFDSIFLVQHFILYGGNNEQTDCLTEEVKKESPPPPYSEKNEKAVIKMV